MIGVIKLAQSLNFWKDTRLASQISKPNSLAGRSSNKLSKKHCRNTLLPDPVVPDAGRGRRHRIGDRNEAGKLTYYCDEYGRRAFGGEPFRRDQQ